MLEEVHITGLGVIDDAVLELSPGFNVVTGETGAGTTMVVSGLGLLFGGRADPARVRPGADRANVEGRLSVAADGPVARQVSDAGGDLDDDGGTLILNRSVSAEGRSRAYAGGRSVPVSLLIGLADDLVAVHGQADQQQLLKPGRQREALDRFAGADLAALLAPRLAGGAALRNATAILRALRGLELAPEAAPAPGADAAGEIADLKLRLAAALPPNLRKHLKDWRGGRLGSRGEQAAFSAVCGELATRAGALLLLLDHVEALDPERLRDGRLALAPLLGAVEEEMRRRGVATFDALLTGARELLARHPEVRSRLRRSLDQLLVDEFQDTDATQCEVLAWVVFDGPAAERPGLFLVGDPKQSIYGWRSADLRAYDAFLARMRAAGGEVLPLVENFRSLPEVLDEVARAVGPVMRGRAGVQPPFAPLVPCERRRGDGGRAAAARGEGRAAVEHWVSWLPEAPAAVTAAGTAAAAALEAEAIAADLRELHDRQGLPWREAAILLRSTGDLEVYLDALRRAAIPFAVGRDKQYYRRREVVEAAALVRAALDPGDQLALVTVLRSPA
ncbi:MAG: UvrD-helicase domain-containing protein, partial [Acidobacteria bacterium]|nr:UvrD-helicase domain-containing protein [Acidobacteriota bacterium]